jgi:hypothetical protein
MLYVKRLEALREALAAGKGSEGSWNLLTRYRTGHDVVNFTRAAKAHPPAPQPQQHTSSQEKPSRQK